jgi:hypothetical protein
LESREDYSWAADCRFKIIEWIASNKRSIKEEEEGWIICTSKLKRECGERFIEDEEVILWDKSREGAII